MKMKIELNETEALEVVAALRDCAVENGWDAEELDECGVIEEYSRAVDVALAAMGISVNININPSYEDENEDEDFDEDDFDFDDEEEEEEEEEEELPSDEEVMNLIMQILYGQ